jgi:N-acetylglucosamine-6-phosphate deacetylase
MARHVPKDTQASAALSEPSDRPHAIWGRRILSSSGVIEDHTLLLEDGAIQDLVPGKVNGIPARLTLQVDEAWVVPGFIDIHTHGGAGTDMMDADPESLRRMSLFLARHGVTAFFPTTMTATADDIGRSLAAFAAGTGTAPGASPLGVHLEGPYVSHQYRGTQPVELLRDPAPEEYEVWLASGVVRLITLAPELPGAAELIARAGQLGIRIAIGHTDASYEQALLAFDQGANQATHLFNGMPALHHRQPGPVGAVLSDDRVYAQLIPDGIHVHPAVMRLVVRAKGVDRTILVSDANCGAGMPDGTYMLGSVRVHIQGGVARNDDGGLAGSTVSLDLGLRNVIRATGLGLAEALPMITSTPAAAMGIADRKGRLAPGTDADIVVLDESLSVRKTLVSGRVVYSG